MIIEATHVGRCPWRVLSCVVVVWRTHRGGLVPRVYTERSDRPWVTLSLCVMIMRRYILGEGGLVPTHTASSYRISTDQVLEPCYSTWSLPGMTDTLVPQTASASSARISWSTSVFGSTFRGGRVCEDIADILVLIRSHRKWSVCQSSVVPNSTNITKWKKRQLWDRGFRRNSFLQAACVIMPVCTW